ncbi:radical SAM protein, partial [Candidatus Parcubacteria bacterium]|nr:radical SAM protein [Candidatus Parcubacteria bacterium]
VIKKNDKTDFLFLESADYYRKNPIGIVFTITHKCTMNCPFCFNSYDYKIGERNKLKDLSTEKIKEAIDRFYAGGIRYIIISGGEPLARPDFFNILDYLCKKKIYVILNTNGVLINEKMAARLCDYPMHIMMSIHQFNNKESNKAANIRNVYSKKTAAVKYLRKYGVMCLEYITILDKKNIKNLEKIYKLNLTDLKPDNWQFFRLFDVNGQPGSTKQEMAAAINKLDKLNRQYSLNYKIVDSVPFCAHNNPSKAAKVISGELRSDHLVKLVTDPIGNIKMMCSFQRDLGNIFTSTAKQCWQKKFAQKMINLEFSPEECRCCPFLKDCCGGSRFLAYVHYGSYSAPDPLANFENIKQFIKA